MKNLSIASHMLKHVVDKHEGEKIPEVEWRMKVLKSHKSSFERHVSESVSIPRLVLKMVSRNVGTSWETRSEPGQYQEDDGTDAPNAKRPKRSFQQDIGLFAKEGLAQTPK